MSGTEVVSYAALIGRTLRVENADHDLLNVVDERTQERFWIQTDARLIVYRKLEGEGK